MGSKKPFAWFTGFAPAASPELVLAIVIEEAGEGSSYAVPVAKDIIEWWATNRLDN